MKIYTLVQLEYTEEGMEVKALYSARWLKELQLKMESEVNRLWDENSGPVIEDMKDNHEEFFDGDFNPPVPDDFYTDDKMAWAFDLMTVSFMILENDYLE